VLLMSDMISNAIKNVLEVLPTRKKGLWTYGNCIKRISSTQGCRNCHEVLQNWNYRYSWHLFRHWAALKFVLDIGGGVVADIGCGYGELAKLINYSLRELDNIYYIGIDIVRDRLLIAENYKLNFEHIFLQFDISEGHLPFRKSSLDAVVCTEVLEHIDKEAGEQLVKECFDSLKDGGRLFISTPFAPIRSKNKKLRAYHIYMRTYTELRKLVEDAGFAVIAETGFEPKYNVNILMNKNPELRSLSFLPNKISRVVIGFLVPISECSGWMAVCEKSKDKSSIELDNKQLLLDFMNRDNVIRSTNYFFQIVGDKRIRIVDKEGRKPANPFVSEKGGNKIVWDFLVEGGKLNDIILKAEKEIRKRGLPSRVTAKGRINSILGLIRRGINQRLKGFGYDFSKYKILYEDEE